MKFVTIQMSPPRLLVLLFFALGAIGTLLLKLPVATYHSISWVDALFTTVSAFTVTGLSSVDTPTTFTLFGQLVILGLIQVGGLGIMSFAALVFIMLGKKIGFQNRLLIQQSLNQTSLGGIIRLAKALLLFSFSVEFVAFLLLSIEWVGEYGWRQGLYASFFHAISAFNNAGFSIWSDNLMSHATSPLVNFVITSEIILGGLGFTVVLDVLHKRKFSRLSLHSKFMLLFTLLFNVFATLLIFLFEHNNDAVMGGFTEWEKLLASYFQAITTRTAGFNTVDISQLTHPTILLMLLLMFIGAGSASTGGGIKLTTFLVMILGVLQFLRQQKDIVMFGRTIQVSSVIKSLSITILSLLTIFIAIMVMSVTEKGSVLRSAFEVFSAFGTVGLTMGLTFQLTVIGKLVITFMMFLGKMGPLTLAFTIAKKAETKVRYPSEDLLTG